MTRLTAAAALPELRNDRNIRFFYMVKIFWSYVPFLTALLSIVSCMTKTQAMETTDDIETNRPSFMFSPLVLPRGALQFENGTLYQHYQHGGTYFDASETQVRLGLTKSTEFEMFVPTFVLFHQEHTQTTDAGVSDLSEVGFKHQFPAIKNFQATFIGALNIPTGSVMISGRGVQPVFRVPWSYSLSKTWSLMGMQSLLLINDGRDLEYEPDFMLNKAITRRLSAFIEYGGFFIHHAYPVNLIHFGAVQKLNKNNQIDMQWGFGMNKAAPAAFVGAGYSVRFDRLPLIDKL